MGEKDFTLRGTFIGVSRVEEQQLQIQKGEHVSSPQSRECFS